MKKIVILLLVIYQNLNSQISLDHHLSFYDMREFSFIKTDNIGVKYLFVDENNWIVNLYNVNGTLFSQINIDRNSLYNPNDFPNGGNIKVFAVSQHLFDTDDSIEFLIYFVAFSNNYNNNIRKTAIIDDDGSILFSVENQRPANLDSPVTNNNWICNTSAGTKMMLISVDNINNETSNGLYIYSLPGTLSSINEQQTNPNLFLKIFPNPTKEKVNILYQLPNDDNNAELVIYNSIFQEIKKIKISSKTKLISINTNNLKKGIYHIVIKTDNNYSKDKILIIK